MIQWEEEKTCQPKQCKNKLYTEICCQITSHAMRKTYKQVEKVRITLEKQKPLPVCTNLFWKIMQLFCAHDINYLINQKKLIVLEDCHYDWRFVCCLTWDFCQNRSPDELNANSFQDHKSATQNTSHEPTPHPQTSPDKEKIDPDFRSWNLVPIQRHN